MSDYSTFMGVLRDYANRLDWSDALVASFITNAESKLNEELRIDRMIKSVDASGDNAITGRCAQLPDDWLEMRLVWVANSNGPYGYLPARYQARDQFFNEQDKVSEMYYTLEGRSIYFGGVPNVEDGTAWKLWYYAEVPVFSDSTPSWVYTKYQSLYRNCALMHADLHAIGEEDKAAQLKQLAEDEIQKLNAAHHIAKASGSRLTRPRVRSFG